MIDINIVKNAVQRHILHDSINTFEFHIDEYAEYMKHHKEIYISSVLENYKNVVSSKNVKIAGRKCALSWMLHDNEGSHSSTYFSVEQSDVSKILRESNVDEIQHWPPAELVILPMGIDFLFSRPNATISKPIVKSGEFECRLSTDYDDTEKTICYLYFSTNSTFLSGGVLE